MATALQAVINAPLSNRLKEALKIAPRLLDSYFALAVQDANDCMCSVGVLFPILNSVDDLTGKILLIWAKGDFSGLLCWFIYVYVSALICALIPLIMARYSTLFPDKIFCYEVRYSIPPLQPPPSTHTFFVAFLFEYKVSCSVLRVNWNITSICTIKSMLFLHFF